jgi:transcriptional regulator NrdR family protein
MNRALARLLFLAGRLHPNCPGCGGGALKTVPNAVPFPDGNPRRPYECKSCGERFVATVEA